MSLYLGKEKINNLSIGQRPKYYFAATPLESDTILYWTPPSSITGLYKICFFPFNLNSGNTGMKECANTYGGQYIIPYQIEILNPLTNPTGTIQCYFVENDDVVNLKYEDYNSLFILSPADGYLQITDDGQGVIKFPAEFNQSTNYGVLYIYN